MGNAVRVNGHGPGSALDVEQLYAGLAATDERSLAQFDAALSRFDPDQSLLSGSPARSLAAAMADLVQALTRIDVGRVNARQGWWHRFTGADLEARLELEVGVQCIEADMQRLAEAAVAAERAVLAMRGDLVRLDDAQVGHETLMAATTALLRGVDAIDGIPARLQRRLGNLEAIYASNRLARAQMMLAIDHLNGLLDRYRDIEQLLFPLWQQHALAVAQSAVPTTGPSAIDDLRGIHARFATALAPSKELAS